MKIVNNIHCDVCGNLEKILVELGDDSTSYICSRCINEAHGLIDQSKHCPECGDLGIIQDEHGRNSTCPCHLPKLDTVYCHQCEAHLPSEKFTGCCFESCPYKPKNNKLPSNDNEIVVINDEHEFLNPYDDIPGQ